MRCRNRERRNEMKFTDWLILIVLVLLAIGGGIWSGYMAYIEQSNKIMLNNYLKSNTPKNNPTPLCGGERIYYDRTRKATKNAFILYLPILVS